MRISCIHNKKNYIETLYGKIAKNCDLGDSGHGLEERETDVHLSLDKGERSSRQFRNDILSVHEVLKLLLTL